MSRFPVLPQIKQLRAANAGVIAFADGGFLVVGVVPLAFAAQFVGFSFSLVAVPSLVSSILADGGTHAPSAPVLFTEVFSQFVKSVSFSITEALQAITAMPSESLAVGVATATSVF